MRQKVRSKGRFGMLKQTDVSLGSVTGIRICVNTEEESASETNGKMSADGFSIIHVGLEQEISSIPLTVYPFH